MLVRKRLFHSFFGCATLALGLLVAPGSESVGRANPWLFPAMTSWFANPASTSAMPNKTPSFEEEVHSDAENNTRKLNPDNGPESPKPVPSKNPNVPPETGKPKNAKKSQPVVVKGRSTAIKALGKTAVFVDAGFRIKDGVETEKAYSAGEISQEEREVAHTKNTAGMVGGLGGATAGASTAAVVGAPIAAMTGPLAPVVELGFVAAGGTAGYMAGEEAVSYAAEQGVRAIHRTGNTISSSATNAWKTATSPVRNAWRWCSGR